MLQSYTNKNIGEFISLPANKLENFTLLETLYFATYINKLKSVNNLSEIKKLLITKILYLNGINLLVMKKI